MAVRRWGDVKMKGEQERTYRRSKPFRRGSRVAKKLRK